MPFSEVFFHALEILVQWAWLIFPFAIFHIGWHIWKYYWEFKMVENIYNDLVFLKLTLPQEIFSTPKSMEQVFFNLHGILGYVRPTDQLIWRIRQPWISLEILGVNGNMYFIIAVTKRHRATLEAAIYSEYPDIEIEEVADYTLTVPLEIPNDEWMLYGWEWTLADEDIWQLKTYSDWRIEEEPKSERNIDPISPIAELCTSLRPGEYYWFQLIISPTYGANWEKRAKAVRSLFDKPQQKEKSPGEETIQGIGDFFNLLLGRPLAEEKQEQVFQRFPTKLEGDIVKILGSKIERPNFEVNFRTLYVSQRDLYETSRRASMRGITRPFADYTNNYFKSHEKTETRIRQFMNIFPRSRIDMKSYRMLWRYRMRYLYPELNEDGEVKGYHFTKQSLMYRLNAQELASIYHFPGQEVAAPGLRRLPFKKTKPPVELPTI